MSSFIQRFTRFGFSLTTFSRSFSISQRALRPRSLGLPTLAYQRQALAPSRTIRAFSNSSTVLSTFDEDDYDTYDMPSEANDTFDETDLGLDAPVKAKKEKKSKKDKKEKKEKKSKKRKTEDGDDADEDVPSSSAAAVETETVSNGAPATKKSKPANDQEQV